MAVTFLIMGAPRGGRQYTHNELAVFPQIQAIQRARARNEIAPLLAIIRSHRFGDAFHAFHAHAHALHSHANAHANGIGSGIGIDYNESEHKHSYSHNSHSHSHSHSAGANPAPTSPELRKVVVVEALEALVKTVTSSAAAARDMAFCSSAELKNGSNNKDRNGRDTSN